MTRQISFSLPLLLLCVCVLHAQQAGEAPFASLEKAVQAERGGFAGDKSRLSKVFDAAWRTRFRPTILSGQAVTTSGVLQYRFVLDRRPDLREQ